MHSFPALVERDAAEQRAERGDPHRGIASDRAAAFPPWVRRGVGRRTGGARQLVEVPEYLFFRRMTPESSTKLKSESEVSEYYAPRSGGALLLFQTWKLAGSYLRAVRDAPVGLADKLCLYRYCARRVWWMRDALARDLWRSCRAMYRTRG